MRKSSTVIAITFAPAVAPLCAIGVAIEIVLAQLCPGSPGIFDGKRSVTVGTFHETSPISSEPPPVRSLGYSAGRNVSSRVARSEEHTSELQSPCNLVCRLLLEKKKKKQERYANAYRKITDR